MRVSALHELNAHRDHKRPVVRAIRLGSDEERLIQADHDEDRLIESVRQALRLDACQTVDVDGARWFLQPFNPPLRMVLVGAVHIAQPLSKMASLAGYAVTIVDPRTAFARGERFEGVDISTAWPDEALRRLKPDARTAVVTLTHDPKLDDPALEVALASPAFYVGSLGSTRTHRARRRRLEALGLAEEVLDRIHAPIGLDIGARSPAEIAVAILAEVTDILRWNL